MGSVERDRPELLVAACSIEAARWACDRYHYFGGDRIPTGKRFSVGVWEGGVFVGAAIYSRGASPFLGREFGLGPTTVAELTRLALAPQAERAWPTSAVLARSVCLVREQNPGLEALLSFADPHRGHVGTLYKAAGWTYLGRSAETVEYLIGGRWRHVRGAHHHPKRKTAPTRILPGKYRYGFPLTRRLRRRFADAAQPPP